MRDITLNDTIAVDLTAEQVRQARLRAQQAAFGGRSQIRNSERRQATVLEDNLVGQLGTLAWSLYHFGTDHYYNLTRFVANTYPYQGDGGYDSLGLTIDVKGSAIRSRLPLLNYHLLVRPGERHKGWVYVLALARLPEDESKGTRVFLVGWINDAELPPQPETDGPFKGAFCVCASQLHPLPAFAWPGVQRAVLSHDPAVNGG